MWFRSALDLFPSRTTSSGRRRPQGRRLQIEPLESRDLLAFDLAVDYAVGASPQAIVTADFNNDGRLDVATANYISNTVSVLLGNVDGTFQPALDSAAGVGLGLSLAVGDFNADGKLDLANTSGDAVNILLGNGNGTFQPATRFNVGAARRLGRSRRLQRRRQARSRRDLELLCR